MFLIGNPPFKGNLQGTYGNMICLFGEFSANPSYLLTDWDLIPEDS